MKILSLFALGSLILLGGCQPREAGRTAPEPQPGQQPETPPIHKPVTTPAPNTHIAFSGFERTLMFACGVLATVVCVVCLFMQNRLSNTQRQYEDLQTQIAKQSQTTANLKQEIGELSNSERLDAFAKAHGFKVINGNIKRVDNK